MKAKKGGRKKKYSELTISTAVRLPETLHAKLAEVAEERDTSVSHLLDKAAALYLERLPPIDLVETDLPRDARRKGVAVKWRRRSRRKESA